MVDLTLVFSTWLLGFVMPFIEETIPSPSECSYGMAAHVESNSDDLPEVESRAVVTSGLVGAGNEDLWIKGCRVSGREEMYCTSR